MISPEICRPWRFKNHHGYKFDYADVLEGDADLQHCSIMPVAWHIGIILTCRQCSKSFQFTASEQKYWYEVLKFWIDSVPLTCLSCRSDHHLLVKINNRLSIVLKNKIKTPADYLEIVDIALVMINNKIDIGKKLSQKVRAALKKSNHRLAKDVIDGLKITK